MQFDLFSPTETETIPSQLEARPVLPKGWTWERLSDLAPVSSEKYQPCNGHEFYVGLEHVEKDTGRILPEAQVEPISTIKNRFYAGDILYGKLRPYLNKVAIAPCDGVCSTDMLVLRPTSFVETRYLHWFMLSRGFVNETSANTTGVNLPRVATKFVENYPVPTPPLPEQTRLVARLETLLGEVDAATARLHEAEERLKTYRQAVLHHILKNEEWERVELGTVLPSIFAGKSFKCEERPPKSDELGVAKVSAVTWGEYDEMESKTCLEVDRFNENFLIRPGDFLFSRANTIELVGACVIVKSVSLPIMLSDKTLRFNFNPTLVDKRFALYFLRSRQGRNEIERLSSGNQESMRNIGQERIRQIEFPLPDIETQRQIVLEIETRLAAAEAMETAVAEGLRQAETLRQGILKRAFSGQL